MIGFLATGLAPSSCAPSTEPQALALPPATLGQVTPLPTRSRLVGRVAAATVATLEDLYGQPEVSGGGLRGGFWQRRGEKMIVRHLVDVRGVAISGTFSLRDIVGRFTVEGRLGGVLTQRGLALTGRIGGVPLHLRLVATGN